MTSRYMYVCRKCEKGFEYLTPKVACLVLHASEDCCHRGEKEVQYVRVLAQCKHCLKAEGECVCPRRRSLLPPLALAEVERCLQHGAEKHGAWSWRTENTTEQDLAALHRHLDAYERGDKRDHESKLHALSHVVSRALFIVDRELEADKCNTNT